MKRGLPNRGVRAVLLLAVMLAGAAPAFAGPPAEAPRGTEGELPTAARWPNGGIGWDSLAPAEQQLLRRFRQRWSELPPPRREALVRGARRWLAATPEERHRWRRFFHHWRELPPDERECLRGRWKSLSPADRERLRDWLRFGRPPGLPPPPPGQPLRPGCPPPPPPPPPPPLDRGV